MSAIHAVRQRLWNTAPLLAVLLVALVLRLLLWDRIPRTGLISDEGEYLSAANWLAHGRGFTWYQSYLWTRAPIYPLFVAAHLWLFGDTATSVYVTQTILSLLNIALVYLLAWRLTTDDRRPTTDDRRPTDGRRTTTDDRRTRDGRRPTTDERRPTMELIQNRVPLGESKIQNPFIPTLSALLMAVYFPFALYTQVLLSETLFITLLLGAFLALACSEPTTDNGRPTNDERRTTNDDSVFEDGGLRIEDSISSAPTLLSSIFNPRSPVVGGRWSVVVAGVLFGLATLTRSLTLAFLPIAALWIAGAGRAGVRGWWKLTRARIIDAAVFLACAGGVILPWTIYNSARLYGGLVVVDTSGAYNLMLGARTAYDGKREDAPPRNFMLALLQPGLDAKERRQLLEAQPASNGRVLDRSCLLERNDARLLGALDRPASNISQAERQQLMTAEGLCLIRARPAAFIQKSAGELIDLFQINYSGDERFADGFTLGRLPIWYALGLFLLDDTIYVLILPLAVIGWALARRTTNDGSGDKETRRQGDKETIGAERRPFSPSPLLPFSPSPDEWSLVGLIGLWWLYNIAVAPLLFAINRFRLPLLPFAFIFAAYALAALPRGGLRVLRTRYGGLRATLAVLLALIAATPYAYLEPRPNGEASQWASYLGPYPSSVSATAWDWRARPSYLRGQQVMRALGAGDALMARSLLAGSDLSTHTLALAQPLLAGLEGHPDDGLNMLPSIQGSLRPEEAAVVQGELLRRKGNWDGARLVLGQTLVDNANPVQFAWDWLYPPPLPDNRIDLAGNLDLGYIAGCYLGEGDASLKPAANFRWCTDGARLRFPGAGTGASQTLALRADGRGWFDGLLPVPPVRVFVGERQVGEFTPSPTGAGEFSITLPPAAGGADVIVTLRTPTFVPGADRYLSQQGKAVVGQVQRLGVRLDWVELRALTP